MLIVIQTDVIIIWPGILKILSAAYHWVLGKTIVFGGAIISQYFGILSHYFCFDSLIL